MQYVIDYTGPEDMRRELAAHFKRKADECKGLIRIAGSVNNKTILEAGAEAYADAASFIEALVINIGDAPETREG